MIFLNKITAIFSLISGGHLVAELQQHWAQSVLGWVTGGAIKKWTSIRLKFLSFFFNDFFLLWVFSRNLIPYETIRALFLAFFTLIQPHYSFSLLTFPNSEQNILQISTLVKSYGQKLNEKAQTGKKSWKKSFLKNSQFWRSPIQVLTGLDAA